MRNQHAPRQRLSLAAALMVLALASTAAVAASSRPAAPHRVLFVGNSLIYTSNLPAVLHTLIVTQDRDADVRIDMFAPGGATLAESAADLRLRTALRNGHYDAVVMQERGGDAICAANAKWRGDAECRETIRGERDLAEAARRAGATVYFLGTYQPLPEASTSLVEGERWLATRLPARYIEISETWRTLRARWPELQWLYAEGDVHPGPALTSLMALRVYAELFGADPEPADICTSARMLTPHDGNAEVVGFDMLIADSGTSTCLATEAQVARMLAR